MKNRFTIGETAEIMGISVQTLRYYSNSGLVTPEYVDRRTGYRYYTFNQLHFIDRIKYLRSLGVPLKGIKEALKDGRGEALLPHLKKQYDELCSSVEELIQARDGLKWYIDYFEYSKSHNKLKWPYIRNFPKRYAIGTVCGEKEPVPDIEIRLDAIRGDREMKDMKYKRQWGYTFDYDKFMSGSFVPLQHYMFLADRPASMPEKYRDNVLEFPAGEYLCFMTKLRSENWRAESVSHFFETEGGSRLIIVNEYEESLVEYKDSPHEIQMLLSEG